MLPLRLILRPLNFINMDLNIEVFIFPNLHTDVIIGAYDMAKYSLYSVNETLVKRFQESGVSPPKEELLAALSSLPFLPDASDDDLGALSAFPDPKEPSEGPEKATFGDDPQLRGLLQSMLKEFADVFADAVRASPAKVPPLEVRMKTNTEIPRALKGKVRPQCPEFGEEIRRQVGDLQTLKVITVCLTDFHSQVLLVRKPDGTLRFCIDYRYINAITEDLSYPLPNIPELLNRLAGNKYFTVLDLTSGYHQCPMHEDSKKLTAFLTPFGTFQFERVPFGLKQAPAYFQHIMSDVVLRDLCLVICVGYIDDIIIYAKTKEELLERTRRVLQRFQEFGITIKAKKCKFGLTSVSYVGYVVSEAGISMSNDRRQAVKEMRLPATMTELRAFLGTTNYFRSFIKDYALLSSPLHALDCFGPKSKQRAPQWTPDSEAAFHTLKDAVYNVKPLNFLEKEGEVRLYTDASEYAIGAHLAQATADGTENSVAFVSKKLNPQQRNWNVTEKEMFAVVYAIKKLHTYIGGRPFVVYTDHRNLTFWHTQSASPKVERWRQLMSMYSVEWRSIPGTENCIADSLSRLSPILSAATSSVVANMTVAVPVPLPLGSSSDSGNEAEDKIKGPPVNLALFHGDAVGHFKLDKTVSKMKANGFTWPGMQAQIEAYIKSCPICQRTTQAPSRSKGPRFTLQSLQPNEVVSMDTMGPLDADKHGYEYILVFVEHMSRFVRFYPLRSVEAQECAVHLIAYICREGKPMRIRSDNGTQFVNRTVAEATRYMKVAHTFTIPYSHQDNAVVERSIQDLRRQLNAYMLSAKDAGLAWSDALPLIERILNTRIIDATGHTPAEMRFGLTNALEIGIFAETPPAEIPENDFLAAIHRFQEIIMQKNAAKAVEPEDSEYTLFEAGELILVDRPKRVKSQIAEPLRDGPFQVLQQKGGRVWYDNHILHRASEIHVSKCRKYHPKRDPFLDLQEARSSNDSYEVEQILRHFYKPQSKAKKNLHFEVKWLGFEETSIEPVSNKSVTRTQPFIEYANKHPELQGLVTTVPLDA